MRGNSHTGRKPGALSGDDDDDDDTASPALSPKRRRIAKPIFWGKRLSIRSFVGFLNWSSGSNNVQFDIEGSSSYGNGSNAKADVLEVLESKSLDMNEKAPSVDSLSNGKSSASKEDGSKSLESESLDVMDKGDGVSEVSQFDITSSPKREVKLSLICNSFERSDFHIPSLDAVFKVVEENFLKLHGLTEFNFSLLIGYCKFNLELHNCVYIIF
ncbi:hypothetical protein SO802_008773 [Lithocarpus litseifolius]|uniref:Uncharacterized protein n=1 Tax=Lithocarpus litseifolius TaxID=425828 RepID=A0AAW2DA87_9ROSI